jgi:hypothetical protein
MNTVNRPSYRLIVGETGNMAGHIHDSQARTIEGARRSLKRMMRPYGSDGWGVICQVLGEIGNRQYPRIERHGKA